jgi:hypothetical protein
MPECTDRDSADFIIYSPDQTHQRPTPMGQGWWGQARARPGLGESGLG